MIHVQRLCVRFHFGEKPTTELLEFWPPPLEQSIQLVLGYVYTESDRFRSTLVRIHSVYTGPILNWNGTVPHRITFVSGLIWYQIADSIPTGSTRSRVNTRLIRTNFVPVPNGSDPV